MLAASFIAIFLIPVTYFVVEKITHKGDTGGQPPSGGVAEGHGAHLPDMSWKRREAAMRNVITRKAPMMPHCCHSASEARRESF